MPKNQDFQPMADAVLLTLGKKLLSVFCFPGAKGSSVENAVTTPT